MSVKGSSLTRFRSWMKISLNSSSSSSRIDKEELRPQGTHTKCVMPTQVATHLVPAAQGFLNGQPALVKGEK